MIYLKKIDAFGGALLVRLLPRPNPLEPSAVPARRFLLIRPGGIGDAVLLIPMILCLRKIYPAARIEVLAEKRNFSAFVLCPDIDKIFCYDKARDFAIVIRRRYDVVIDSEQWHRLSAIVARVIRSRIKIGFGTNEREKLFTHTVGYSHRRYEQDSFFELLSPLKVATPATMAYPFLSVPDVDQKKSDNILKSLQGEPFIALFPGASIPERCWGGDNFRELAIKFIELGFLVVVVGGQEDSNVGDSIVAGTNALNLAGKTSLCETAGILNRSLLLISGDSGVLHLGMGLDVSTVSLFGPGIAAKWAPRGEQHMVIDHQLPCSSCTKFGTTPPCPIGVKCMWDISVEEVFAAAQHLLSSKPGRESTDAV